MNLDKKEGISSNSKLRYIINYCPLCGTKLDFYKTQIQTSTCPNCNADLNKPFDKIDDKDSLFLICSNCTFPNPFDVKYCAKCGSDALEKTIEKNREKAEIITNTRQPLYLRRSFHYFVSLIVATAISTYLVLGVARNYLIVKNVVAALIIISFSILLSFFIFIILSFFIKPK